MSRSNGCQCGDMPGRCPGPRNCPLCQVMPVCVGCGTDQDVEHQDANDDWRCDECHKENISHDR